MGNAEDSDKGVDFALSVDEAVTLGAFHGSEIKGCDGIVILVLSGMIRCTTRSPHSIVITADFSLARVI